MYVTENCSGCSGRSYSIPYRDPNHKNIKMKGFGALEEALDFRPISTMCNVKSAKGNYYYRKN